MSTLEDKGVPSVVERVLIRPPCSRMGPASDAERRAVLDASPVRGRYDTPVDRVSAYEKLVERTEKAVPDAPPPGRVPQTGATPPRRPSNRLSLTEVVMREVGRTLGREIIRGILGSIFKGRR